MLETCLAPVILAGYLNTLHLNTSVRNPTNVDSPMVEIMSCEKGAGVDLKLSDQLYGFGVQYGISLLDRVDEEFKLHETITFLPKLGLSYAHDIKELPLETQFSVGAQLLMGFDHYRVGVEYWHLSNAGIKRPNMGIDTVSLQFGYSF